MNVNNFIWLGFDELTQREWDNVLGKLQFELPNGDVAVGYRRYLTKGYFKLPRGAWYLLPNHVRYHDKRVAPEMPELNFTLKLDDTDKDERFAGQMEALKAMFENEQGQIIRPPGTGKTQIALAFAAKCRTRTLVLVHTADILKQWVDYTEKAIPELKGKVGVIQGKTCKIGHITIGMVQTLGRYTGDKKFWQQFGAVIADEAHHVAAPTWEGVLNSCPAYYRFGFTASATRADGMHPAMKWILGPIIYRQKFTSPVKLEVVPVKTNFYAPYRGRFDWGNILRALIADEERNRLIAKVVDDEIASGNSVLVLSRRIEHLGGVAKALQSPHEILTAERGRANRGRILEDFRTGRVRCVLATQLADEALDVPRLNRICLTHPGKHEGRIVQQIGRALRQFPDKKDALIYDFYDPRVGVLRRQWDRRKLAYRQNKISLRKRGSLWQSRGRKMGSTSSRRKLTLRRRSNFSRT